MDGWMDGWMHGWMDGWTDGCMDGWMDEWMDGWMDGWMGGWMDGWMDGWVDGWMDEWVDGWMDGWMDGWVDGWMGGWVDGWMGGRMDGWMDGWMDAPTCHNHASSRQMSWHSRNVSKLFPLLSQPSKSNCWHCPLLALKKNLTRLDALKLQLPGTRGRPHPTQDGTHPQLKAVCSLHHLYIQWLYTNLAITPQTRLVLTRRILYVCMSPVCCLGNKCLRSGEHCMLVYSN